MIKTTECLINELKDYKNPRMRIGRMVDQGKLFPVRRGIYEDDRSCPPKALAGVIYGPSYLSFEYALALYDLIPERVAIYTSATIRKNRTKSFSNVFGVYEYRDIPAEAFPYGITIQSEGVYSWLIASPEKALCDLLYVKKPVKNFREFEKLMFDSLRLEEEDILELDMDLLLLLAEKYPDRNVKMFGRWLKKNLRGGEYEYPDRGNAEEI